MLWIGIWGPSNSPRKRKKKAHSKTKKNKQENGIIERSNKEILRQAIIFNRSVVTTWKEFLPLVQYIIYSTVHE